MLRMQHNHLASRRRRLSITILTRFIIKNREWSNIHHFRVVPFYKNLLWKLDVVEEEVVVVVVVVVAVVVVVVGNILKVRPHFHLTHYSRYYSS